MDPREPTEQSRTRSGQAGSEYNTHSKLIETSKRKKEKRICGTERSFKSLNNDSSPQLQLPWKLDLNQLCLGREHDTMTNSTPGHVHPSDPDGAKAADEIIILILGAVVFVTFALGLVSQVRSPHFSDAHPSTLKQLTPPPSQLYETPIFFSGRRRRRRQYWDDEDDEDEYQYYGLGDESGGMNAMSDLEAGTCTAAAAQLPLRSATRYGSITPHIMDINGVTKMVLVVDAATPPTEGALDSYTEWFATWRKRMDSYREQQLLEETAPLLGDWS